MPKKKRVITMTDDMEKVIEDEVKKDKVVKVKMCLRIKVDKKNVKTKKKKY